MPRPPVFRGLLTEDVVTPTEALVRSRIL